MKRIRIIIIAICILVGLFVGFSIGTVNQRIAVDEPTRIYIPEGSDYSALLDTLDAHHCLHSHNTFNLIAKLRGLNRHVKCGSYILEPNMRTFSLVLKLYSGNQDPVRITINN